MQNVKFFDPNRNEDQFNIHIDYNRQWFHDNAPIARNRLPILFATALHYDAKTNEYWLVTPHEQGRIQVADIPYIITDFELNDDVLILTSNLGHEIKTGPNHQITCLNENNLPYVTIHNNVKARLNRSVREALIHIAINRGGYNSDLGILVLNINNIQHIIAKDD
jgi:hypothetical protein